MNVSEQALDLIKKFEGLRLKAYLDPVGIPTIGYGTIRYPDGGKVALGDSISESEAVAFMKFECDRIAGEITQATTGIPQALNQNQFDALVSFCFNLGIGAFLGSTMLRLIKGGRLDAAAAEFPKWNKATVDGVKVELLGLTKRRASEQALFQSPAAGGTSPAGPVLSNQEKVKRAKGFRSGNRNLLVAFDGSGNVMEILELANSLPDTLAAAIRLYPNLGSLDFADQGETVPAGEHVKFAGVGRPVIAVANPPSLHQPLLILGSEDTEGPGGNDVRNMQSRLRDLGYYSDRLDGIFGPKTDRAVRDFQAEYFGAAEADGKVGPKTWAKLWGDSAPTHPPSGDGSAAPGKNYLSLTKINTKDQFGLVNLVLAYFKDGVFVNSLEVCSGQAIRQVFRKGVESRSHSMEPLPEGKWRIHNIEWADGKDNYSGAVWNNGLGPAKIRLDYLDPARTDRADIEIHIDWNRTRAPGTAGCVGLHGAENFKTLVNWLRDTDPRFLYVDWGLGSCPAPSSSG